MNQRRIIGYRRNGCPIWEIRGASQPAVEQGGQQQGQGDDLGDLLGDPPGDGQSDGGDGGDAGDGGEQAPGWARAMFQGLEQRFTSEIDRRIDQLSQQRRTGQAGGQQDQGHGQQQSGQPAALDLTPLR